MTPVGQDTFTRTPNEAKAGDTCVLYTAADGYMREFTLCTPADCIVSLDREANHQALNHMKLNLKADLRHSTELDASDLP